MIFNSIASVIIGFDINYDAQLTMMFFEYMFILIARVLLFLICIQFSPGFNIKSNLNDKQTVEIIGLNMKGYEMFKFELLEDKPRTGSALVYSSGSIANVAVGASSTSLLEDQTSDESSIEDEAEAALKMTVGSPTATTRHSQLIF